jgi:hypothetical protein
LTAPSILQSRHVSLADPSANLAAGLCDFAAAGNRATPPLGSGYDVHCCITGKLEEETAGIVKSLSTKAMGLVWATLHTLLQQD